MKILFDCGLKHVFRKITIHDDDDSKTVLSSLAIGIPVMILMLPITLVLTVPTMIFIIFRVFYLFAIKFIC